MLHAKYKVYLIKCISFITDSVFIDLLRETGAKTVVWTALYEPWIADRDSNLKSKLESRGIKVCLLNSSFILRKVFEKKNQIIFFFFIQGSC